VWIRLIFLRGSEDRNRQIFDFTKLKIKPSHSPMVVPNTKEDDRSRLSADTAFWSFFGCEVQTETGDDRFQPVSTVREGRKEGKPTDCRVGELRTADYKEGSSPSQNAIALALALFLSLSLSPSCLSGSAAACAPPSSSCSILRESNRRSDDKVSPCFLFLFLLSNFWK
jgi:hypothetical protein